MGRSPAPRLTSPQHLPLGSRNGKQLDRAKQTDGNNIIPLPLLALALCSEAGDTSELIYHSCQAEGRPKVTCFFDVSVLIGADHPAQRGEDYGSRLGSLKAGHRYPGEQPSCLTLKLNLV